MVILDAVVSGGVEWDGIILRCFSYLSPSICSWAKQAEHGSPNILLSSHILQLLFGDPKTFPVHMGYVVPPVCSGSAVGSSPSRICPKYLHRDTSERHPDQMPEQSQLASNNTSSSLRMFELLTLSQRSSPDTCEGNSSASICDLILSVIYQSSWP